MITHALTDKCTDSADCRMEVLTVPHGLQCCCDSKHYTQLFSFAMTTCLDGIGAVSYLCSEAGRSAESN